MYENFGVPVFRVLCLWVQSEKGFGVRLHGSGFKGSGLKVWVCSGVSRFRVQGYGIQVLNLGGFSFCHIAQETIFVNTTSPLHSNTTTPLDHASTASEELALQCINLDDVSHGWVPAGHPRYTRAQLAGEGVGGPHTHEHQSPYLFAWKRSDATTTTTALPLSTARSRTRTSYRRLQGTGRQVQGSSCRRSREPKCACWAIFHSENVHKALQIHESHQKS